MKRLRLSMIIFCVLLALPTAFVAWRTYGALDRETRSQVRFFSDRLLEEIESELADMVRREENRAVDEYRHTIVQDGGPVQSPLARTPAEPFILGYFQNNPDGSFQSPLVKEPGVIPAGISDRIRQLQTVNTIFNQRKLVAKRPDAAPTKIRNAPVLAGKEQSSFADRFLRTSERKKTKRVLGQETARVEEITAGQAMNLAQKEPARKVQIQEEWAPADMERDDAVAYFGRMPASSAAPSTPAPSERPESETMPGASGAGRFQVEVAPLQAVAIDDGRVFIFRRIGIDGQIYRQGFVLRLQPFLDHLFAVYYDTQPIARYARLTLNAAGLDASRDGTGAGLEAESGDWVTGRSFPPPFRFLSAEMHAVSLPPSPARQTLTLALAILGIVMVAGLVTIYHSARAVQDLSERRSQFVSAVTHELKTPLTNIRMYIEMLEQGIAATPEREQEYFGILTSESARLSGLINNVLELSRLEKQTRRFDLKEGDLTDVLADVQSVTAENLAREGYRLTVRAGRLPVFAYDREVLVQVLINLMENSVKFGRHLPDRHILIAAHAEDGWVTLTVSDTGPGIPRRSLKQVFDDFYRVDNDRVRATGGTGLGLALVKKFILAMGGRVAAENNTGPGCTITLSLPASRRPRNPS
jgi:signal transduction histidine kinase